MFFPSAGTACMDRLHMMVYMTELFYMEEPFYEKDAME